jgi:ankyrin repeat protein
VNLGKLDVIVDDDDDGLSCDDSGEPVEGDKDHTKRMNRSKYNMSVCSEFDQENQRVTDFLKQRDEYLALHSNTNSASFADQVAYMSLASSPYALHQVFFHGIIRNDIDLVDRILRDMGISYLLQNALTYNGVFTLESCIAGLGKNKDSSPANIFWLAALNGSAEVLDMLTEETLCFLVSEGSMGYEPTPELVEKCKHDLATLLSEQTSSHGFTPLIIASSENHASVIQVLFKYGVDPNYTNREQNSAALLASSKDCVEALRALAEHENSDFDLANKDGVTPFLAACQCGSLNAVQYLLNSGKMMDFSRQDKNGNGCTAVAARFGREELVAFLCQCHNKSIGIDINQTNCIDRSTALHEATRHNYPNVVRILLEEDPMICDAAAKDDQDMTALHIAAMLGYNGVVREIVNALPTDVMSKFDTEDKHGLTPLFYAIIHNHENVVKLLAPYCNLGRMCKVSNSKQRERTATDITEDGYSGLSSGRSRSTLQPALVVAAIQGNSNIIYTLLHAGAQVNQFDRSGYTPLIHAAANGHMEAVEVLVAHGADVKTRSHGGRNAIQKAKRNKYNDIASYLEGLI